MLLRLPDDATRLLTALLGYDEVHALGGVCKRTASHPLLRGALSSMLVLSSDEAKCRRLVNGLHSRHSVFKQIQVIAPWQVDLLVKADVSDVVETVRVKTITSGDAELICEKLRGFSSLHKLDASASKLDDVSAIGSFLQLQSLNLSDTTVSDISSLATLTRLQELRLENTDVEDFGCVETMLNLRVLTVSKRKANHPGRANIPPLFVHTSLHTLKLQFCSIESAADLGAIANGLKTLSLVDVRTRLGNSQPRAAGNSTGLVNNTALFSRLTKLTSVDLTDAMGIKTDDSVEILAKIPSLCSIKHRISKDLHFLAPLVNIEELYLRLCSSRLTANGYSREDLSVLLRLPRLKALTIVHNS